MVGPGQDVRQLRAQEAQSLPNSNATFQKKGADLVDDAGALANETFSYAVPLASIACRWGGSTAGPSH
jgi:hypothetical protein